jgi:hypothetical protein
MLFRPSVIIGPLKERIQKEDQAHRVKYRAQLYREMAEEGYPEYIEEPSVPTVHNIREFGEKIV